MQSQQNNKMAKEKKQDKLKEITELLQRTQANFENYKKLTEGRVAEVVKMSNKDMILQLLPILDNFELALKSCDVDKNQKDFCEGVNLIYAQIKSLLENNGVKEVSAEGVFDPHFHEALMKVESSDPEGSIVEVVQKGYTLHEQVIRHAKVKVSSGKDNSKRNGTENPVSDERVRDEEEKK